MPIRQFDVSLAAVANVEVIPPGGMRINAVSVMLLTPGASCGIKLGNNDAFTCTGEGLLRIGNEATAGDAKRGLIINNVTAQAGAIIRLLVSYSRATEKGGAAAAVEWVAE